MEIIGHLIGTVVGLGVGVVFVLPVGFIVLSIVFGGSAKAVGALFS